MKPSEQARQIPWIKNIFKLFWYIWKRLKESEKQEWSYGGAIQLYAEILLSVSHYLAHKQGHSIALASAGDLQFIALSRGEDLPFAMVRLGDTLHPQYDIFSRMIDFIQECNPLLVKEAENLLAERSGSPRDRAHWQKIVDNGYVYKMEEK